MLCNTCVVLFGSVDDTQSHLSPLVTDDHPKSTLMLGNRPLISFPLEALAKIGVKGYTIICLLATI